MPDPHGETKEVRERRILIISDTHGTLPDWIGKEHFDAVLHAGDIGDERVLTVLHGYETLHVVRGNIDAALSDLPETIRVTIEGVRFFIVHNLTSPHRVMPSNAEILAQWRPQVVVFGHTHRPLVCERDGVVYVNPGTLAGEPAGEAGTYAVMAIRDGSVCRAEVYGSGHQPVLRWPQ